MDGEKPERLRVTVQQPSLAKYRVPVFRELASRPGIDFRLVYSARPNLPNVEPDGFIGEFVPMRIRRVLGRPVYWYGPQLKAAQRANSDVAVFTWDLHYASLVPALLRAKQQGVGTVLWGHGYSKQEAGWRARARSSVARLADALLFYNDTAADQYKALGYSQDRLFVALNTIDQAPIQTARDEWAGETDKIAAFRAEQGLGDAPLALYVSRLEAANRVDLLLEAQARLSEVLPSLIVAVIGKGDEDERLRDLAGALGVADRVRFLGAIYDEAKIAPWFAASSVFCYPANIGLSGIHAMGHGLPVVTGDRIESQNPEIVAIEDGVNGVLFRHGDAADLAEKLRSLFEDNAMRSRMAEAAHRTATERFSLENMVDGMEAAIRFASGRARSRR